MRMAAMMMMRRSVVLVVPRTIQPVFLVLEYLTKPAVESPTKPGITRSNKIWIGPTVPSRMERGNGLIGVSEVLGER